MAGLLQWCGWLVKAPASRRTASVAPATDPVARAICSAEGWLVRLQKIAVWESPVVSVATLAVVNAACWLVSVYQLRPVFVVAALALLHLVRTQWRDVIWPEIRVPPPVPDDPEPWTDVGVDVLSAPEVVLYVERLRASCGRLGCGLAEMRAATPFLFAVVVNAFWSALYVLSGCVSGAVVAHVLLTSAVTVPAALLHLVPASAWSRLHQLVAAARRCLAESRLLHNEDYELEFVPDALPETQAYLDVMADVMNGREPSPECVELAAFSSGLAAAPDYDEESDDDEPLAPSLEPADEMSLRDGPSAGGGGAGAAAAIGLRALAQASAVVGRVWGEAGRLVTIVYEAPSGDGSDSDFELIGEEEARAVADS